MRWLKSHKRLIGFVAALVLVVGISGFAFTRGYFMRFVVDGSDISRDEFWRLADASLTDTSIHLGCAQGDWTLGWLYIFEVHCFSDDNALEAYMDERFGT